MCVCIYIYRGTVRKVRLASADTSPVSHYVACVILARTWRLYIYIYIYIGREGGREGGMEGGNVCVCAYRQQAPPRPRYLCMCVYRERSMCV